MLLTPVPASVMPMPTTIWFAFSHTDSTISTACSATPASAPHKNPSQKLPLACVAANAV